MERLKRGKVAEFLYTHGIYMVNDSKYGKRVLDKVNDSIFFFWSSINEIFFIKKQVECEYNDPFGTRNDTK